jgi:hypothetical protein
LLVAAVMIVVLVPLVLRAAQAAPPAIAEFAPQVTQAIKKAPPGQNSVFGSGPGATGPGVGASPLPSPSPSIAASPPALVVPKGARVNKCIGDPPRQVEDPQSPPCVPFWDPKQGNGGATTFGVTATTITLALPNYVAANAGDAPTMANFFNDRFEFYGRKLVIKNYADSGAIASPEAMQADAQKVEALGAFADLGYPPQSSAENIFYDALARLKHPVIGIEAANLGLPVSDQAHLAALAPYQWNYVQTPDIVLRNLGEMICKQLAGRPASRAGATLQATVRKFGVIREALAGRPSHDPSLLVNAMKGCTGAAPEVETYAAPQEAAQAVSKLSLNGVTSIVCLCDSSQMVSYMMPSAQGQTYEPEWITSNIGDQDGNESFFQAPPSQARHAMGIRSKNKELATLDSPYIWAIHYESPNNPKPPYQNTINAWDDWVYDDLLLVASGIQLAGPHLTPETFAAGLHQAEFPNPGCNGPPYYQACVGFQGGSHSMQQSFGQIFWDPSAPNNDLSPSTAGAYCYVAAGTRRTLANWAGPDRYGNSTCR